VAIAAPGVRSQGELGDRQHGATDLEHGSVHRFAAVWKNPRREGSFGQSPGGCFVVIVEHGNEHDETTVDSRDLATGDRYGRLAHPLQQRTQETPFADASENSSMLDP